MKIVEVSYDDWAGLYVNERLFCQDHSIYTHNWVDLLMTLTPKDVAEGITYEQDGDEELAIHVLQELGQFPETWVEYLSYGEAE